MGLGELNVHSYLDQPFDATIDLLDTGSISLTNIQASLASPADYERVGLQQANVLGLLTFQVEKNAQGAPVVQVRSMERISEPYLLLMVDLAWADGQIYRSYPILLDPPHYKMALVHQQIQHLVKPPSSSTEEKKADKGSSRTYGPTGPHETIWQIAIHYKTADVLLQQVILAFVGNNPEAFTEGNLNGLKEGAQLEVPSKATISRLPSLLAKQEVLAHDKAWQTRTPIVHVLLPPYIEGHRPVESESESKSETLVSVIPPSRLSDESRLIPLSTSLLSLPPVDTTQKSMRERDLATAAIDSIRDTNAELIATMRALREDNKRLEKTIDAQSHDLRVLRKRLHQFSQQHSRSMFQHQPETSVGSTIRWSWVVCLGLLIGGIVVSGYRGRAQVVKDISLDKPMKSPAAIESLLALSKICIENKAYEKARFILQTILLDGNDTQKTEAKLLLARLTEV